MFDTSGHKRLQRRQYQQDEFLHHLCQQCRNSYGINHSRPGDHCLVNLYRNAGLAGVPGTSKVATGKDKLGMIASLADMHARISQRPPNVMVRKPKHQSRRRKCARGLYSNNQDKRSCSTSRWKGVVHSREESQVIVLEIPGTLHPVQNLFFPSLSDAFMSANVGSGELEASGSGM